MRYTAQDVVKMVNPPYDQRMTGLRGYDQKIELLDKSGAPILMLEDWRPFDWIELQVIEYDALHGWSGYTRVAIFLTAHTDEVQVASFVNLWLDQRRVLTQDANYPSVVTEAKGGE